MALSSMTGFGRGEATAHGWKTEVELSSVNRKQFDVRMNLPRSLSAMEAMVAGAIHKRVARGHVNVTVRVQMSSSAARGALVVDRQIARNAVKQVRKVATELKLPDDLKASSLLQIPDVLQRNLAPEDVEEAWPMVSRALEVAMKQLLAMRREEGRALQVDLSTRMLRLQKIVARIEKMAPRVAKRYRDALLRRLKIAELSISTKDPALLRELAIFADRSDISEELTRLNSHFGQVDKLMNSAKPVGRELDFLCQELFREINTTGSKANDDGIAREAIRFKAELEAVREQVQNIE